jgi:hypothetical protein
MIDRAFATTGYLNTALMAYGVAALWLHPGSSWATGVVYLGLVLLMLTPVSRVAVAGIRYIRAGDFSSALLTLGILAVLALSGWAAWTR